MKRTPQFIEESKSKATKTTPLTSTAQSETPRYAVGRNPNSLRNLAPYKKGVSGNPGGKPKLDIAASLCRAAIEGNQEIIYKGLTKAAANGNAYAFSVLADRGYGKVKETISHEHSGTVAHTVEEIDAKILEIVARKRTA